MVEGGGSMKLRHSDPLFLARVDSWWAELLPKLKRFLHVNGGNVLMVQVSSHEKQPGVLLQGCSVMIHPSIPKCRAAMSAAAGVLIGHQPRTW